MGLQKTVKDIKSKNADFFKKICRLLNGLKGNVRNFQKLK